MIENYSLHYCYRTVGDVLLIEINPKGHPNKKVQDHDTVAIYQDDELIGINIFNFGKIVKVKNQGMIYLPSHAFIDVVNSILQNAHLPLLSYKDESGYVTGRINEIFEVPQGFLCVINLKGETCSCFIKDEGELKSEDIVVVALKGSHLSNGEIVKERSGEFGFTDAHLCSYFDLGIEEKDDILAIDEDIEIGVDFFQMKEKI